MWDFNFKAAVIMHKFFLSITLVGMCIAQTASAGVKHAGKKSEEHVETIMISGEDLSQAEYVSQPVECTVVEVATQYESSVHGAEFHCIVDPDDPASQDGLVFELQGLPPEFEQTYRSKFNSGRAKLKARKLYRSQYKLIFTTDTVWSITDKPKAGPAKPGATPTE